MKTKLLNPSCQPVRSTGGAAGFDVYPNIDKQLVITNEVTKVPLGFAVEIPKGFVGLLLARSGLSTKERVTLANTVGVIDSDYRGEVMMPLVSNHPHGHCHYMHPGDRIGQLVVVPIFDGELEFVEELSETQRGEGGFGSTGT